MYFSQIAAEVQKKLPLRLVCISDMTDIQDVALLDGQQEEFCDTTLYFGYREHIHRGVPAHCILAVDGRLQPALDSGDLAQTEPQALFAAFNLVRSLLEERTRRSFYAELIKRSDETRNLDMVLNAASTILGNSVLFSDMNFKIVSHSTTIPVNDPLWKENVERGFCSYEFIAAVRQLEAVQKAARTTDAIEVSCTESPYRKLSSKVFLDADQVGFVLMIEGETAITPAHLEAMSDISRAVTYTLVHYQPYLIQSSGKYQQALYDLMIGTPPDALAVRLAALRFPARMAALSLRPTQYLGIRHLREHTGPAVLHLLPNSHLTYHEDGIVVLAALEGQMEMSSEQMSILGEFAGEEHMRIGVSNGFSSIQHFPRGYAQARAALSLGERLNQESIVCRYLDYQFYDLLAQIPDTARMGFYCHPALALLRQYDRRNDSDLYHTLRAYLENGGSIKGTAAALFIHRNSLTYRLERITDIGQIDLEDPAARFLLRVSYHIDRYLKHDK